MAQKIILQDPRRQVTEAISAPGVVKLFRVSDSSVYVHVIQPRSMVKLELGDSCAVTAGTLQIYLFSRDLSASGYACEALLLAAGEPLPIDA